jgi:hypothetical protein
VAGVLVATLGFLIANRRTSGPRIVSARTGGPRNVSALTGGRRVLRGPRISGWG